jgi:serine/threonine-protein kinase
MPLSASARIGPYEVIAPLGAGGMGEVYRGRDTQLNRTVAIKILPELFANDHERLGRFTREAQTLAALNHPNIAQIYGLERETGHHPAALVMELVDGEDLSAIVGRGPIRLADALPIARQIAEALEAAHEAGIVHRDLKPANVKVRADGAVKVLDFGLAKAADTGDPGGNPANSPTMAMTGTRAGLILGTAGYMAPEQARGQAVDRRADIWAFGVVLFEMLAGARAFKGDTISDVLASVLKNDLDWSALPKDVPAPISQLLRRCLDPDRRTRLRDIGEARIALSDFIGGKTLPQRGVDKRRVSPASIVLAAAGVIALAAAVAVALPAWRGGTPDVAHRRFVVSPPEGVSAHVVSRPSVALSPDGSKLVFVGLENGVAHLFIHGSEDFDARKIPATAGASNPVFSPGGKSLAFFADNRLCVMPLEGTPRQLATINDPRGLDWIDEATLIYTPESVGGVFELSVNGGGARAVTTIDPKAGERTHRWPHVLPGGEWVLFTVGTTASPDDYDAARIDAVNRSSGERRTVFQNASMARYVSSGHLVFTRGGSVFAVKFDTRALTTSGTPVSVLDGVSGDRTTGAAHVTWSADGTLAYVPADARVGMRQLVWSSLKGARESINLPPSLFNDVRISPDGSRLALVDGTSGRGDIWVYTFSRGTYTRLTFTTVNATPIWSADGRDIFFAALDAPGRSSAVMKTSADGGREPIVVSTTEGRIYLKHVSRESSWAIVDYVSFGGARANVGRLPLRQGAKIEPLVETKADEYGAAVSPDGRFLAYQSDEAGHPEVYVRELSSIGGRWQVSNAGGEEPMWSLDGRTLYYRAEDRFMQVHVDKSGAAFSSGVPQVLFDGIYNLRSDTGISYDPHPDGTRLLMTRRADAATRGNIRVITRWFDELNAVK